MHKWHISNFYINEKIRCEIYCKQLKTKKLLTNEQIKSNALNVILIQN